MVFFRNPSFRRPFFKLSIEADRRKAIIAARGTKAPDEHFRTCGHPLP
jgi:hypothetical protein